MPDLNDMTGPQVITWLLDKFADGLDPHSAGSGVDARDIALYLDHGLTDTEAIATRLRADARRRTARSTTGAAAEGIDTSPTESLRALPSGYHVEVDDLDALGLIGGLVWAHDPDGREEWLQVGREAFAHERLMCERPWEVRTRRLDPTGKTRDSLAPREVVTALHRAGRGPTYAREIIRRATEHTVEIDAFGFGDEITPAVFSDMAAAGITRASDLDAYLAAGLSMGAAIRFRADGIAPAAVLMAKAEGHPVETWHDLLAGLPLDWFRPLGDDHYTRSDAAESYAEGLTHHLNHGGSDRYRIADLRSLVEAGWTGEDRLSPCGLSVLAAYNWRDVTDQNRYEVARLARRVAEHGLTWSDVGKWAEALTVGKKPGYSTDVRRPPLFGWGRGRGTAEVPVYVLDGTSEFYAIPTSRVDGIGGGIVALADAGLKPSHMAAYRKAGCTTIAEVLTAHAAGITPKDAERLCKKYGRQPDPRVHKTTWVIDSHVCLMAAWRQEQAETAKPGRG
jgi:hypothetical protein